MQAAPISGAPGPNGYNLNVAAANRQPVTISHIFSANAAYQIAGSTTTVPLKSGKAVPFYGSLSHGLDKQVTVKVLQSANGTSFIPRTTVPPGPAQGVYGGCGLGALIGTQFSWAFQGSGAIPPAVATDPTPGTTMKADDSVFYTFNAITNGIVDSTGKTATSGGSQYFVDETDPANPIYGVVALPKFTLAGVSYSVNVNTSLADGVTSRYTLVFGGQSYLFDSANQVTANRTRFTFNPLDRRRLHRHLRVPRRPRGQRGPHPDHPDPVLDDGGRAGHRGGRLQRPGRAERRGARGARPAVHLRPGAPPR